VGRVDDLASKPHQGTAEPGEGSLCVRRRAQSLRAKAEPSEHPLSSPRRACSSDMPAGRDVAALGRPNLREPTRRREHDTSRPDRERDQGVRWPGSRGAAEASRKSTDRVRLRHRHGGLPARPVSGDADLRREFKRLLTRVFATFYTSKVGRKLARERQKFKSCQVDLESPVSAGAVRVLRITSGLSSISDLSLS
jgi:hypothetical protein